MHICWRRIASSGYTSWQRIQLQDGTDYTIDLLNITAERKLLPKISAFSHPYLSAVYPDEQIWFQVTTDGGTMRYF